MAITKIHAIKRTLSKALTYIENPEKTDGQLLVSGYNVDPQLAAVEFEMTATLANRANHSKSNRSQNLAYHLIQSFSPNDDITPEQAHALGKKLANEFGEGRFEYVISTHIDKGHIHNHIIFNAVSFYDYKKMRTIPYRTARQIRAISDCLCAQANLSILADPQEIWKSYSRYHKKAAHDPWRTQIRKRLEFILQRATSYDEFLSMANQLGLQVNDRGAHITYRMEGAERAIRGSSLADTEKYCASGIREQLAANDAAQSALRESILAATQGAADYPDFLHRLNQRQITVATNKRSGLVTYHLNDANNSKVSECVLGSAWSTLAIQTAIRKRAFSFSSQASDGPNLQAQFEAQAAFAEPTLETLVELSQKQILKLTQDGLLLRACDQNGQPIKIMIDRNHVDILPDGRTFVALNGPFDYYFCDTVAQGYIKGEALIEQLEAENHVRPLQVQIGADQIKQLGLKGVTISLPSAGVERLFIPAKYLHLDRATGTCSVDLYTHWQYSYVPTPPPGEASHHKPASRKSLTGQMLANQLATTGKTPVSSAELQRRIGALRRKAALNDTRLLAGTLQAMVRNDMRTAADFAPQLKHLRAEAALVQEQIQTFQQKNKLYALAARYLATYQEFAPLWREYQRLPARKTRSFKAEHQQALEAWEQAKSALEHIGVDPAVDPNKVAALVKERNQHIKDLQNRLAALRSEEKNILEMQAAVEQIQNQNSKEKNHEH